MYIWIETNFELSKAIFLFIFIGKCDLLLFGVARRVALRDTQDFSDWLHLKQMKQKTPKIYRIF